LVIIRFLPSSAGLSSGTLAITHNATTQSSPTNVLCLWTKHRGSREDDCHIQHSDQSGHSGSKELLSHFLLIRYRSHHPKCYSRREKGCVDPCARCIEGAGFNEGPDTQGGRPGILLCRSHC
jgi:hypothetical protein